MSGIFDRDLDRNAANSTPLTPLSFLSWAAHVYPEKTAVIHGERTYAYAEFQARCRRLASALSRRGIGRGERHVRAGQWLKGGVPLQTRVSGKRLGIVGMGRIGKVIARRASGFDMKIAYHSRRKVADAPFTHYDKLVDLAKNSDYLVAIIPGGKDTYHLINEAVLRALGITALDPPAPPQQGETVM